VQRAKSAAQAGRWSEAELAWEDARLLMRPDADAAVLAGLARARRAMKAYSAATEVVCEGRDRFPDDFALLLEDARLSLHNYRRAGEDEQHTWKARLLKAEPALWSRFEAGTAGEKGLVVLADVSLGLKRWDVAARLWNTVETQHPDRRGEACLKQADACRRAGELRSAREALGRVPAESRGRRFATELQRLGASLSTWTSSEMAGLAQLHYSAGEPDAAATHALAALSVRGQVHAAAARLRPLVTDLTDVLRAVEGGEPGSKDRAASTSTMVGDVVDRSGHAPPITLVSGLLYSGSGAVFDFLRCHPLVHCPYGSRELGVLKGQGNLRALLDETARESAQFPRELATVLLASLLGFGQRGRPLWSHFADSDDAMSLYVDRSRALLRELHAAWCTARSSSRDIGSAEIEALIRDFLVAITAALVPPSAQASLLNNALVAHQLDGLGLLGKDARALVVVRDPRDQYVSQQLEGAFPMGHPEFVQAMEARYEEVRRLVQRPGSGDRIAIVRFEEFVTSHAARARVLDWLALDCREPALEGPFDPARSSRNIGIHRDFEDRAAVDEVGEALGEVADALAPTPNLPDQVP
jgi:hypothetical protein